MKQNDIEKPSKPSESGGVYLVIADNARLKSHPFSDEHRANIGRFLGEMRSDEEMKSLAIARKPYWPSVTIRIAPYANGADENSEK